MFMSTTNQTQSIHLQGIGRCAAKPAGDLAVGDVTIWNYGYRYTVTAVRQASKCFVEADMTDDKSGKSYTRRLKSVRLVAVA